MKSIVVVFLSVVLFGCNNGPHTDPSELNVLPGDGAESSLVTTQASEVVLCSRRAIDNGDGWGWDDGVSCQWPGAVGVSAALYIPPECTFAADDHGDGWGWENEKSCRWGASTATNPQPTVSAPTVETEALTVVAESESSQCSASALDTGDGWGWEFGAPCQWGNVQPDASVGAVYVPGPVFTPAPGYTQGKPICLTDSSDGNDDGFGFENNRTCAVVEGTTATPERPLVNTRWCQPWAEIAYGDYVLQNNTWNDSEVYYNNWHQCIELTGWTSDFVAKWDYNWLAKDNGNEFSVKSYPQVYYGRKTRNSISGPAEKLGVPAHIDQLPSFKVKYKYSETGNAERNVALESFFHTSCEAEEWNKQFEMMVWVGVPVTRGPGPKVAEVEFDGVGWDVHVNPTLGWGYVAFVAQNPSQEGWLDWNKFVTWTRYTGPSFGVPRVADNTCMGAIEIGTETFWGQGTFTLNEFEVHRQ